MLVEVLQDRAALYVSGAMTAPERENFELILEFHDELRLHVVGLQRVMTAVVLADVRAGVAPPSTLKARILGSLGVQPPRAEPEGFVVTDPSGRVEWINEAFTAMCGYTLSELKGRKPGHILQGPDTDVASVERIREALRSRQPCRERIVNYHKNGARYIADVRISPILDDEGEPLWFVAKERTVLEPAGA
jgi:PAS domain S-box-containing protein